MHSLLLYIIYNKTAVNKKRDIHGPFFNYRNTYLFHLDENAQKYIFIFQPYLVGIFTNTELNKFIYFITIYRISYNFRATTREQVAH